MVEVPDNLEEATRLHIKRLCEKNSHNITNAAKKMNVSRNTVRKYLEYVLPQRLDALESEAAAREGGDFAVPRKMGF